MTLQRLVEEKTRRGWYNIYAFHFQCRKMIKWMPMDFSSPTIVSTIKLGKLMANSLSCATIMPTRKALFVSTYSRHTAGIFFLFLIFLVQSSEAVVSRSRNNAFGGILAFFSPRIRL